MLGDGLWDSWDRAAGLSQAGKGLWNLDGPGQNPCRADATDILRTVQDRDLVWAGKCISARTQHRPPPIPAAAHILPDSEAGLPSPGTARESLPKAAQLLDPNSSQKEAASKFRGRNGQLIKMRGFFYRKA